MGIVVGGDLIQFDKRSEFLACHYSIKNCFVLDNNNNDGSSNNVGTHERPVKCDQHKVVILIDSFLANFCRLWQRPPQQQRQQEQLQQQEM
jgi:hypothetical protein